MNTRPKSHSSHGPRGWLALTALAAIGGAALIFISSQEPASAQPAIPAGYDLSSWRDNGEGGKYLLQVVDGELPQIGERTSGVVLSDTNCEPDAQGLNHCRNGIRLANGTTINVIDNHMMTRYRCLQPGETVSLATFSNSWVVALTAEAGSAQ